MLRSMLRSACSPVFSPAMRSYGAASFSSTLVPNGLLGDLFEGVESPFSKGSKGSNDLKSKNVRNIPLSKILAKPGKEGIELCRVESGVGLRKVKAGKLELRDTSVQKHQPLPQIVGSPSGGPSSVQKKVVADIHKGKYPNGTYFMGKKVLREINGQLASRNSFNSKDFREFLWTRVGPSCQPLSREATVLFRVVVDPDALAEYNLALVPDSKGTDGVDGNVVLASPEEEGPRTVIIDAPISCVNIDKGGWFEATPEGLERYFS